MATLINKDDSHKSEVPQVWTMAAGATERHRVAAEELNPKTTTQMEEKMEKWRKALRKWSIIWWR